jgi:triosephosphate isomerase (TIM)
MEVTRVPLIAGNWKMNLDHLQAIAFVQKLAWSLKDHDYSADKVEVAVFPPFTDLRSVQTLIAADKLPIELGAQDLSPHDSGAHTGDVSGAFLSQLNCQYVIIGHSERRADHHETDELVAAKTKAALKHGLIPVVCVGETAEDRETHGSAKVPVEQLRVVLDAIPADAEYVIAYEPVWAIGSGTPATADEAEEVCAVIRQTIADVHGQDTADKTRVLYGGSVKSGNIAGFMKRPNVDGALVGGASLDVDEFSAIVRFPDHVTLD